MGVSMNFVDFVHKLELAGIDYEVSEYGNATYVEFRDRDLQLGFRFNHRGDLNGGWLHPGYGGDFKSKWKRWGEYLQ